MIVPIVLLDIFAEIYKNVCFRLYGLELPKREEYIVVDRQKLSYLKPMEKVNCVYCGYANGFLAYMTRIAADTEGYWCGIKHQQEFEESKIRFYNDQTHHKEFIKYGDESAYKSLDKSNGKLENEEDLILNQN
jgi:hypothetical protein